MSFNGLTPAETERLALLVEELGEAIHAVGKILRHGYRTNPLLKHGPTNREALERELADIRVAMGMLANASDISWAKILKMEYEKVNAIGKYLHHQPSTKGDST